MSVPNAALSGQPESPVVSMVTPRVSATVGEQIDALTQGQPPAVVAFLDGVVRRAADTWPEMHHAFWDVLDTLSDEVYRQALRTAACLPGCTSDHEATGDYETCQGPTTELPAPDGMNPRENELLEACLVRRRDPEEPTDHVSISSGGIGVFLVRERAETFADQLVTFAAHVRSLARQATPGTQTGAAL